MPGQSRATRRPASLKQDEDAEQGASDREPPEAQRAGREASLAARIPTKAEAQRTTVASAATRATHGPTRGRSRFVR